MSLSPEEEDTMMEGWLSLRVRNPREVGAWYERLGLQIVGGRSDVGTVVIGTQKRGRILVLIPGEPLEHPERLQIHLAVENVDAEYEKLVRAGIKFSEPPKDMPWLWRHAYTKDPSGHMVELCSPLPSARDVDSTLMR
jgi:predicted enzyme related to lactoylglutathione lyase